ncbi:MAG: hypothetical protein IKT16_03730 [Desulfovibrio sp.]|nr:hypothetical protein [Desulfovibrio sp.]
MKKLLTISALCGALLLSGCLGADTSDPRRGGLFGYSPKTYDQRIQDRESRYQQVSEENTRLQQESASLEQQKKQKQADVAAQKKKLNQVNADIKSLKGRINRAEATPAAATGETEAQKAAKIRSMQQELQRLEAEADALSRL